LAGMITLDLDADRVRRTIAATALLLTNGG
jgi:hypothetical protein